MSVSPIHRDIIVKTLNTGEKAHLGGFTYNDDTELARIKLKVFVHGTPTGGSEQIRLGLYSRSDLGGLVANSAWANVADFVGGQYWLDLVRFDFDPRQFLDSNSEYHLAIETQNYTRNGQTFYVSVVADWNDPVNTHSSDLAAFAAEAHAYGYRQ